MFTRTLLSAAILLSFTLPAFAQTPWQFRWQKGLVLTYKIKHTTSVVEVVDKATNTSSSNLDLVNRWHVTGIDAEGVATLSMTLVSMRNEQKRANGETLLFDSENPDKSTPELHKQMTKFIGSTLAIVRMDKFGRVLEVKQGSAATYETEPPFLVVFPDAKAAVGQAWRRPFNLVLDPPFGAGEKYEAHQRYECKKLEAGKATLSVATKFATAPDNMRDRIPLMQKEVQGELIFDVDGGRLISAQMSIDKTVEDHQGKGSSYQFKSQYSRVLVD
ncbi:MAG: hypothetical protein HY289_11105 [Planctomycetes bacterium]|nr:hypothetical protein [Planctomycetota bacterium]